MYNGKAYSAKNAIWQLAPTAVPLVSLYFSPPGSSPSA
jgi:hypothetical protein